MLKNLNSEQKNILASIRQGMDFAADIAHACITVYLASDDKRFLRVYHQSMPKTQFLQQPELAPGREVRISEEPLIARCLQRNVPLEGKRELSLGQFAGVRVYPVQDRRGKCFAAVVFDLSGVDDIFINVAFEFLKTPARPEQDSEFYRRLAPGDALMVVDAEKKIIAANSTARHIFQVVGITTPIGLRTNSVQINWPLVGMVLKTGTAEGKEIRLRGMLLAMRVVPVGGTAEASYAIVILRDITELKKRDEELLVKAAVIKEIHHRVKNNLQTIASLLRLQMRRAKADETKSVLRDCISRVNSIAVVHEFLAQQGSGTVDMAAVAQGIYKAVLSGMAAPELRLTTEFSADNVVIPSEKATSMALVLNEMLQNCFDHAFTERTQGAISVELKKTESGCRLTVCDDGNGLPPGFNGIPQSSLGLRIIKTMAEADLHGTFKIENRPQGGTCAEVAIPLGG